MSKTLDGFTYYPSTRKNKKLMVEVDGEMIHFGAYPYEHYYDRTGLLDKKLNHKDKKRRKLYRQRHSNVLLKNGKKAYLDPHQPAYHSYFILW